MAVGEVSNKDIVEKMQRVDLSIPLQRDIPDDDVIEAIGTPATALASITTPLSIQGTRNQAFVGCNITIDNGPHVLNGPSQGRESETPLLECPPCKEATDTLQGKYEILVQALRNHQKKKYRNVKPLPFIQDSWHCVNDIYVECKISVMNGEMLKNDPRRWSPVTCRHKIFDDFLNGKRVIVEGEAGFGKTTLLLQFAYDWCTSAEESPLKDVDIFILLRLKKSEAEPSIYNAIRATLPDDLPLTSEDIKDIITSGLWKVVLAFDGDGDYLSKETGEADFLKIFRGRLLTSCVVIVATRPSCLKQLQGPTIVQYRLSGFDRCSQEKYIEKVLSRKLANTNVKELIMTKLYENDILFDICKVPLIFVLVSHVIFLNYENEYLNSVTSYFRFMLTCLFSHVDNKDTIRTGDSSKEDPVHRLEIAKLAYDGLKTQTKCHWWIKDDILQNNTLGYLCYKTYIETGILLEEKQTSLQINPGAHENSPILEDSYVRFLHVSFQEFYAAHYCLHIIRTENEANVNYKLSKISLHDHPNVFRFLCGLNSAGAGAVHKYLKTFGNTERIFSLLCTMEQDKDFDQLISRVNFHQVGLTPSHTKLHQLSKIQLLLAASKRKIRIPSLYLTGCLNAVDMTNECLLLTPYELRLPKLQSLRKIVISGINGRDLRKKAPHVLAYSAKCEALKHLKFSAGFPPAILPQFFDDQHVLAALQSRRCRVSWGMWKLNLVSGRWEHEGREITDTEYDRVINYRRHFSPLTRRSKYPKN